MIKIEHTEVSGWKAAVRGMRNPMNSWDKSDTIFGTYWGKIDEHECYDDSGFKVGNADHELMMKLTANGAVHAKYRRMIIVTCDITAPLYWWKEFDTYKVGTVANSCSTMHMIHAKPFELDDFSHEHLLDCTIDGVIDRMNFYRDLYIKQSNKDLYDDNIVDAKTCWWQMIQLLPSSYNQRRTVQMNYEVLSNIIKWRQEHKLDEWREFCRWGKALPYAEVITGSEE